MTERHLDRRGFLMAAGVVAATVSGLVRPASAHAAIVLDTGTQDWRRLLADGYLTEDVPIGVRPLQDGLELWKARSSGYMIVETSRRTLLEASATGPSPYLNTPGELSYLGPGAYVASDASRSIDLRTGETMPVRELRALGRDAVGQIRDTLVVSSWDAARLASPSAPQRPSTGVAPLKAADDLPRLKSGDAKSRVPNYSYITGSHVYRNDDGICGWVAGSIVTRYWHARSSARKLLPTRYRDGTNMTSKPNFASYLQGDGGDATWAPNVEERLVWNAKEQKVGYVSSWALGNIGMWSEIDNGYPSLVFGNLPTGSKKKGAHAVVAYGRTNSGYPITHYGWEGYTDVILNSGSIGSNARFRLK